MKADTRLHTKRHAQIQETAHAFALHHRILLYPCNLAYFYERLPHCRIVAYSTHCKKMFGGEVARLRRHIRSDDGYTDYDAATGRYITFYNDGCIAPWRATRMRWTLAHELGHIVLNHHAAQPQASLHGPVTQKDRLQDAAANVFAAELLAPLPLLLAMEAQGCPLSVQFVKKQFGLSSEAAANRLQSMYRKKIFLERYAIAPTDNMRYYAVFARLPELLLKGVTPVDVTLLD